MTKRKRRALIWVGSIFGIITIAAVIFVATLDSNKAKRYISAGVSKATGRQLSIKTGETKTVPDNRAQQEASVRR
jgi:uncharacterized protein involved in outer membrane biogenesis